MIIKKKYSFAAVLVGCLVVFLHVFGVATDHWVAKPTTSPEGIRTRNLWRTCDMVKGKKKCSSLKSKGYLTKQVARARVAEIASLFLASASVSLLAARQCVPSLKDRGALPFVCAFLLLLAGVLGDLGAFLFCEREVQCLEYWGYSWVITAMACVSYYIVAALAIAGRNEVLQPR